MTVATLAIGVSVDDNGYIVVKYMQGGREITVDITAPVGQIAEYVFMTKATSLRAVGPGNGLVASNRFIN
jgi:hypothetical protein